MGHEFTATFFAPTALNHRQRVAKGRGVQALALAIELGFESCGVTIQAVTAAGRVKKHLFKTHQRFTAKAIGMGHEMALQLLIARQRQLELSLVHKLHLLAQTAAHDRVVAIKTESHRLPHQHLSAHMIVKQALQFLLGGRPLPGAHERLHHRGRLLITDNNLRRALTPARAPKRLQPEQGGTHHQERDDGFLQEKVQAFAPGHQAGLYQIGLV